MNNQTAVALLVLALSVANADQPYQRELTATEENAVGKIAENALKTQGLWQGKVYLTNTEVIVDQSTNPPQRYALLTFYRYDGDLAILATVHLAKMTVASVQEHPHMPTSLAPQEIDLAQTIARAHPEIKKALAKYQHVGKIEVDASVARIISQDLPGYQHRVARLFFRDAQRNYLHNVPMVDVDLTTGEVRLEQKRGIHDNK